MSKRAFKQTETPPPRLAGQVGDGSVKLPLSEVVSLSNHEAEGLTPEGWEVKQVGDLWENFLFMERLKKRSYQNIYANGYFWRTWERQEIDLIEEREGKLFAFEFKWGKGKTNPSTSLRVNLPKQWTEGYPEALFKVIDRENYLEFTA